MLDTARSEGAGIDAKARADSALWFAPNWTVLPLAARRCRVRNPLNGAVLELSSGEYAALAACEGCGTLSEHEARVAERLRAPPEHRGAIRALLERYTREGMLVGVEALVARFGASTGAAPPAIAAIAVRTSDRPALLARLLASAEALQARSGRHWRWLVIDDSRDALNQRANGAEIGRRSGLEVTHYNHAAAAAFVGALRAEFPRQKAQIDWLLEGGAIGEPTYGRSLNHALLCLAGRALLTIDDDVVLEPRRAALSEPGFAMSDDSDELLWFESDAALQHACPPLEVDPLALHGDWLGLALCDAWPQAERDAGALAAARFPAAHACRFAPNARVLFTQNHACGDPGSSLFPFHLLSLPARSRAWLAATPSAAAHAFSRRINWRGQPRLRLATARPLTLTTVAGIDNTHLMPPTARSGRNEDLLLGKLAQLLHPAAWYVDLPFGLVHRREPAKSWLGPNAAFAQEPLHFLIEYIDGLAGALLADRPEDRLATVGAWLLDLAATSEARLTELLEDHAADAASRVRFAIAGQMDDVALPPEWKSALASWLSSPALALDPDALRSRIARPQSIRNLAQAYGQAVLAWPQLWAWCREERR